MLIFKLEMNTTAKPEGLNLRFVALRIPLVEGPELSCAGAVCAEGGVTTQQNGGCKDVCPLILLR